jgi:hypothetical protein
MAGKKTAAKTAKKEAPAAALPEGFLAAEKGYALGVEGGKLVCINPKGQRIGSVPKELKESEVAEQLAALVDWLAHHERAAVEWAEGWMLRSLPLPAATLAGVWPDTAYQAALMHLVVAPVRDGGVDLDAAGMLRGAEAARGVGVVDRDGETAWLDAERIAVPHPIVLDALDDWRALAVELGAAQGTQQLFREVFGKPADLDAGATAIERFSGGKFKQLNHAIGTAKTLGFRVSGGSATCRVLEGGATTEARLWIGDEDPMSESETGSLVWVDAEQAQLELGRVGPIAFSEGMRMASAIYAKRVIEEEKA